MAKHGRSELHDVLLGYVGSGVPKSLGFSGENEGLGSPRASSPANPFFDEIRSIGIAWARRGGELHREA